MIREPMVIPHFTTVASIFPDTPCMVIRHPSHPFQIGPKKLALFYLLPPLFYLILGSVFAFVGGSHLPTPSPSVGFSGIGHQKSFVGLNHLGSTRVHPPGFGPISLCIQLPPPSRSQGGVSVLKI